MGIIIAIVIFLAIILLHELGHFFVAKAMGVGIVEYSVGMGPLLWSHRFGDTVFSIRCVPFGGYCAMCGEDSAEAEGKDEEHPEKKKPDRTYLFGQPDFKTDWREDQKLAAQSPMRRLLIYVAGPAMNMILGILACFIIMSAFAVPSVPEITAVKEGTPAAESGIHIGDVITKVNDRSVLTIDDYQEYRVSHAVKMENGFTLTVERDGRKLTIPAEYDEDGTFGIEITAAEVEKTPFTILEYTGNEVVYMVRSVTDSLYMLFTGSASINDMTGIIGMTAVISDSVNAAEETESGSVMFTALFLLALLSINLGLLNMLPIPALDGGRVVLCLIEEIRRKPVSEKTEMMLNTVGMILLMMLMCYVLLNDVLKILTGTLYG